MFVTTTADRWRPNWPLVEVFLALSLYLIAFTAAVTALRMPLDLGYTVIPTNQVGQWRVAAVWHSSFAWDAGLRRGMLVKSSGRPTTTGVITVAVWGRRCCQQLILPPHGDVTPEVAAPELSLATLVLVLGAGTMLLARARGAALVFLVFCLDVSLSLCGLAAYTRGARWGNVLFEVCWFVVLPPVMLVLAARVPPHGRKRALGWRVPVLLGGAALPLDLVGFASDSLYVLTREALGVVFLLSQIGALALWLWRGLPERDGPHWPEYRLVLVGLGGAFAGFGMVAIVPALLRWHPPWPSEAGGLVLVAFPLSLARALLRHRLLDLRRPLQRTALTVTLLAAILVIGLLLSGIGSAVAAMSIAVLLAGVGVPLVQRAADHLLPDAQVRYATLLQRSGERLRLAVDIGDLGPILDEVRRGLDLTGLCLRAGAVLARSGAAMPLAARLPVLYDKDELALLEVGEKVHDDTLSKADREALGMLCLQLGAFLAGQQLTLRLHATVTRLEETQQRLLTARRLERERLGQRLHRGPLQDILLLRQVLRHDSEAGAAASALEAALRGILTETASSLPHLGLPAALRAIVLYLAPYAHERGCALSAEADDGASALEQDAAFALYQLAHEALVNAVRHSGATVIALHLDVDAEMVTLEVRDNGVGLPGGWDHARVDHRGLRDALDLVGTVRHATATASTLESGGAVIVARVPLRPERRSAKGQQEGTMEGEQEPSIRLLIAEDHTVVRQGLRRVLLDDPRLIVVAEASTGHEILSLVLEQQPDVVLLDIDLPGQSGLEALRSLRKHVAPLPRIVLLSAYWDEEYVRQARELGVMGFLSKSCDGADLRQAVYRVMAGQPAFDPVIAGIAQEQTYSERGRFRRYTDGSEAISPSEMEVLRLMKSDASYEEIGEHLGRAYTTVRSQAATICQKLQAGNRQQAVIKALQLGILRLDDGARERE